MNKSDLIKIRNIRDEDFPFILDSWLKSLRYSNDTFKLIDKQAYKRFYPQVITALLLRSMVQVACLQADEDVILGYSVVQGPTLHFVFVKEPWRRIGLMNDLVKGPIESISHITKPFIPLMKKHKWSYNPFL